MKAWAAYHGEDHSNGTLVAALPMGGSIVRLTVQLSNGTIVTRKSKVRTCTSPDDLNHRFRFAVVRHPLRRVVSAFHDKVQIEGCAYPPFKSFCAMPLEQQWPAFVDQLTSGIFRDVHVMRQVDMLRAIGPHKLQAIVRVESLTALWPWILESAGFQGPESECNLLHSNKKTVGGHPATNTTAGGALSYAAYLGNAQQVTRLLEYYRDDLEVFKYDPAEVVPDAGVLAKANSMQRQSNMDIRRAEAVLLVESRDSEAVLPPRSVWVR